VAIRPDLQADERHAASEACLPAGIFFAILEAPSLRAIHASASDKPRWTSFRLLHWQPGEEVLKPATAP